MGRITSGLRRFIAAFVWPPVLPKQELGPGGLPDPDGIRIAYEEAGQMLRLQYDAYDSLDAKAATIIGALLVIASLVVPNLEPKTLAQWLLVGLLGFLFGHALVTAYRGYSVEHLTIGVTPASIRRIVGSSELVAKGALAYLSADSYAENRPIMKRKSAFAQMSLRSLALSTVPLALLFISGAFMSAPISK